MLFFCIQAVYGIDLSGKEIEAQLTGEYNRGFNDNIGISAVGGIELNKIIKLRSGVLYGINSETSEINSFLGGRYSPFSKIPLSFSLVYIYNGLLEYKTNSHSILPFISYNTKRAGISIGPNFKFTSFFGETAQFESILSLFAYYNFINNEVFCIGVSAGNFSEFYAKNIGAFSLSINAVIRLDENLSLLNEFELMQSGGIGLTVNFYGFCLRGGARFTW